MYLHQRKKKPNILNIRDKKMSKKPISFDAETILDLIVEKKVGVRFLVLSEILKFFFS